ncbi:hypothetical protein B0H17DRAFT_1336711 [Mycena rosella]|uniref:MYND-type domain-containing protein n=1 Tax=Mycena rosella TaxID=1033263 RepID=A0AAD7G7V0_MYCRO|nr:hypothetical protein B0H17DRAFT_1336711 [Mycena rosella]
MVVEGPNSQVSAEFPEMVADISRQFANFKFTDRDVSYLDLEARSKPIDRGWSFLHLAVQLGDLPLAHEFLRLGIPVDREDNDGQSPLYFGLTLLFGFKSASIPARLQVSNAELTTKIQRVCLFLISHHADPNETHGNTSLLASTCTISSWDLISALLMLLRHAALRGCSRVAIEPGSNLLQRNFLQQFRLLVFAFVAPNGLSKTAMRNHSTTPKKFNTAGTTPRDTVLSILDVLVKNRGIEPAYAAAARQAMLTPSPASAAAMPKTEWIKVMETWNDAVDAYIAFDAAERPPEIIEAAAKIGLTGGPLYRKCEGAGCANTESSKSAEAFSCCSGCKTAVYCSRSCQKSAWRAHKQACRARNVQPQLLPSQEAYAAELARVTGSKFA